MLSKLKVLWKIEEKEIELEDKSYEKGLMKSMKKKRFRGNHILYKYLKKVSKRGGEGFFNPQVISENKWP